MSSFEHDHALMEGERIGAWMSYSAARNIRQEDLRSEGLFGSGFDRGWRVQSTRIAELEQQLEAARKDAERYRWAVSLEDNAETLYGLTLSNGSDKRAIDADVDHEMTQSAIWASKPAKETANAPK